MRAKGKKKGKGKGQSEQASPFAQTSPWPTSETTYAFPSPFTSQAPVAPTTQLGATDTDDVELILAVKEQYPDISKAPSRIQSAVAKAEKKKVKQLQTGLQKTSKEVGIAGKELQALREAQSKHRERWIKHLQESVQSWEQQLKLYTEQQANYNNLIKKATQELNTARQTLEVLNKKAAGSEEIDEVDADAEDQKTVDAEAQALVQQVQTILQSCAKVVAKEETMEISDSEEAVPPGQPAKRQRSLEPFSGPPGATFSAS